MESIHALFAKLTKDNPMQSHQATLHFKDDSGYIIAAEAPGMNVGDTYHLITTDGRHGVVAITGLKDDKWTLRVVTKPKKPDNDTQG